MADILYKFNMNIPLKYNAYEIQALDKESEQVWGLKNPIEWKEPYHISVQLPIDKQGYFEKDEEICYCISGDASTENELKPASHFNLVVNNVIAFDRKEAYGRVERVVHNVCRALSIMMNTHNVNIHSFQSRVAAAYDEIEWQEQKYTAYSNLIEEPDLDYVDENGVRHIVSYVRSEIRIGCSSFVTLYGNLQPEDFMVYMNAEADAERDFVMEEYYLALGTENITSKFFHLFSIIEYIEKKYSDLSMAVPLLMETEVDEILQQLKNSVAEGNQKKVRILDRVRGSLLSMTSIGREKKLVNILHAMKIEEFTNCATPFVVDEVHIKELTALRNKQFHGGISRGENHKYISTELAVTQLFYICNGIIKYIVFNKDADRCGR